MQYTLKELRARRNLTQDDLAKMIGVSEATVRNWERYPGSIKCYKLQALADIFGVKLDEIFIGLNTENDSE